MDRRHFFKLTGGTIGSLAFSGTVFAESSNAIQLPSSISALTAYGMVVLHTKDKFTWTAKDLIVILKDHPTHVTIQIQSPHSPLFEIILEWPMTLQKTAMVLPDHWERTYGDTGWKTPAAGIRIPWYFLVYDTNKTKGFGVKTGPGSICSWNIKPRSISLHLDTRNGGNGVTLGERTLHAADVVTIISNAGESAFETGKRFCSVMCEKPRLPKQPVYGINDWYFAYGKNSYDLILQHTSILAPLATDLVNRPFSVIDAGWATYSPLLPDDCCWQDDYSKPNDHFKDMAKLASEIKNIGMRPGLWTRPLCGKHNDPVHLILPSIPGRNDQKKPVLDPSVEENILRVRNNITTYRNWGYEMVKHDFTTYDITGKWGFEMKDDFTTGSWHFRDQTKTTAEIILNLYHNIREAAGEMYLIGCNTISHLSAGVFELNRIGDDTSGNEWDRTRKMGVNTLAFRAIQHNHFYAADADCVGLTKNIEWSRNKQWMELLAKSGTPLFISAQPEALGEAQKAFIKECFSIAARQLPVGEPLDWMQTLTPEKWKLNGEVVNFDWS